MIVRTDIDVNRAYPILYKGYVYRMLGLNIKSIPHWLEVGLSEFFGEASISGKDVFIKLEHTIRDYAYSNMDRLRVPLILDLKPGQYVCRTLGESDSLAVRGDLLAVFQHLEESEEMLKEALKQDPKNVLGNEGMGILFLQRGDDEQAGKYFTAAAELGSGNFLAHYYAAQTVLKESHDLDKAKAYLEKALTLNPAFEGTKKLLGIVYESQKMKEQAESAQ